MRHTPALAGALALALVSIGVAVAANDPFQGHRDSAVGSGTFGPGCTSQAPPVCFPPSYQFSFTLSAHSDPLGGDAQGSFRRTNVIFGGSGQGGPVTCLNVVANTASIGGILDQNSGQFAGEPYLVYVIDSDPANPAAPDLISPLAVFPPGDPDLALLPADFPNTCPPPVSPYGYLPLTSGDITVNDATCERVKVNPNDKVKCKHPTG